MSDGKQRAVHAVDDVASIPQSRVVDASEHRGGAHGEGLDAAQDARATQPRRWWRVLDAALTTLIAKVLLKLLGLALAAGIISIPFFYRTVHDDELVMMKRWGALVETPVAAGPAFFLPFIHSVHQYDAKPASFEIKPSNGDDDIKGIPAQTRDMWRIGVQVQVFYKLNKSQGKAIVDNFGADDSDKARKLIELRILAEVSHAIQNLVPQYSIQYLLAHRAELEHNVLVVLGLARDHDYGTQVDDAGRPIPVVPPNPLPWERLAHVGIDLNVLATSFELPKEYHDERSRLAAVIAERAHIVESRKTVQERIRMQNDNLELAKLADVLAVTEAKTHAAVREAKLQAEKGSPINVFLGKWNGMLPQTLVTGENLAESFVETAVQR